jgi:fumarate hydratase class I
MQDTNPDPELTQIETQLTEDVNQLGIGPMGFGGSTTVLGSKVKGMHRLPASYYISIAYMCWAHRRRRMIVQADEVIYE